MSQPAGDLTWFFQRPSFSRSYPVMTLGGAERSSCIARLAAPSVSKRAMDSTLPTSMSTLVALTMMACDGPETTSWSKRHGMA